jgi:short-subunit dehydrogenase
LSTVAVLVCALIIDVRVVSCASSFPYTNVMKSQTVVITGASDGIGQRIALMLAARGANLVLAARNQEKLNGVARSCEQVGASAVAVPTDVSKPEACRRMVEATIARFGGIDILVNNAGVSMYCPFEEVIDLSLFDQIMKVNYLGAVYCTHFALRHLQARKGLIVAISSLQGKTGFPGYTAYCASKHALQGFFDSLRIELRSRGVDVLVVSPGPVATEIHTKSLGQSATQELDKTSTTGRSQMDVDECARQILRSMERRRRELVMTRRARLLQWVKMLAPGFVDSLVAKAVHRFHASD